MFNPRRSLCVTAIGILVVGIGGCATAIQKTHVTGETPVKLLIVQSPMQVDRARLQRVFAPNAKQTLSITDEPIATGVSDAQQSASRAMASSLAGRRDVVLVTPPASAQRYSNEIRAKPLASSIPQDVADGITKTTGANALLRFQITDYGLTPRAWRTGYITFEVTSTLALAGVIAYAGSTVAKAAAGTYLVQEGIEETAESYAGFWALDVEYRPVRIEAELIRLNPVKTLWSASDTGLSDTKLSRLTSNVSPGELDKQLTQSTQHAVKDIVAGLGNTLGDFRTMGTERARIHPVGPH